MAAELVIQTILAGIGALGTIAAIIAAIVAFIAHLSKEAIGHKVNAHIDARYATDLERLKSILKSDADAELERLKATLKSNADAELERLKAELAQSSEAYKLSLKKSELLFQKEFEAASAFMRVSDEINPRHSTPNMEWEDAVEEVAHKFSSHEELLNNFRRDFGAILTKDERESLSHLISTAGQGKHQIDGPELDLETTRMAEQFWSGSLEFNEKLIERVRDQTKI